MNGGSPARSLMLLVLIPCTYKTLISEQWWALPEMLGAQIDPDHIFWLRTGITKWKDVLKLYCFFYQQQCDRGHLYYYVVINHTATTKSWSWCTNKSFGIVTLCNQRTEACNMNHNLDIDSEMPFHRTKVSPVALFWGELIIFFENRRHS